MLLNTGLFGDFRLSTLICWRSTRISASSRALDRNSLISAHTIKMRKSIIGHQHRPIRQGTASQIEFPVGPPNGQASSQNQSGENLIHYGSNVTLFRWEWMYNSTRVERIVGNDREIKEGSGDDD